VVEATRPATPSDLPALGKLGALLVRLHHAYDAARFIVAIPRLEERYASFLGDQLAKPDVVLVAEQDGVVVGYAYGAVEGPDYIAPRGAAGVCHDLVIDPVHRARGVGRSLLDAMLSALLARGAPRVVLMTAEQNAAAQQLFERVGFRRTMVEMTRELDDDAS
jgi:ribosomal protein S18 acetylase RimI-like enzyme